MNIFALSKCPVESAQQMLDKHVVKMPTETCQMLHTNLLFTMFKGVYGFEPSLRELKIFHEQTKSNLMKPAMLNHPSTIWARESLHNTKWLYEHGLALCEEFTFRYEKTHGSEQRILDMDINLKDAFSSKASPVKIAMLDKYRIENTFDDEWEFVIQSYRHYYLEGKWRFAEWRKNRRPNWFPANQYEIKYNEWALAFNKQYNANIQLKEE
jgi:hypothetical protein|tara:strand:- start:607 stop:1239 length:633 start_codon:yes stop_codon:yes gene_type:complete